MGAGVRSGWPVAAATCTPEPVTEWVEYAFAEILLNCFQVVNQKFWYKKYMIDFHCLFITSIAQYNFF